MEVLRELENLPGLIIGGHILNNVRYADELVLIAETEWKLQSFWQKVTKENENKGLNMNCKRDECMVVSKGINPKVPTENRRYQIVR